jgi:exonuclease SbcD
MTLRLLHTADWHLGHQLHGFDRAREHAAILSWLLETIEREQIDVLLVAGDVFDSANPSTEAVAQWYRFLGDAWRRFPTLQVVVIGGNHDSASRLETTDPFLRALDRIHVVGGATRRDGAPDLARHVIELKGPDGKTTVGWVAAVPHLRATETGTGSEQAVAAGVRRFYAGVLDLIRARRTPDQPIIAMGHLYVVGGKVSNLSERRLSVGNETAIAHDLFPNDIAYAALGHLHLAQEVGGRERVRYSGSLLPLSLSERDYPHQAIVVAIDGPRVIEVRELRASRPVKLPRIPEDGAAPLSEALAAIRALPSLGPGDAKDLPLLEVEVRVDKPEPLLRQKVEEALQGRAARLARLGVTLTGTGATLGDPEVRAIADLTPEEVFCARWKRDHEGDPPPDVLATFHELLDLVYQEHA